MDWSTYRCTTLLCTGLYVHWKKLCVVGLCVGGKPQLEPDIASLIFAFCVLWTLSYRDLWPSGIRKPNDIVVLFYELMVTLAVLDIVMRLIWEPLVPLFPNVGFVLQILLELFAIAKDTYLRQFAEWLQSEAGSYALRSTFAGWMLYQVLYATRTFDDRLFTNILSGECGCRKSTGFTVSTL